MIDSKGGLSKEEKAITMEEFDAAAAEMFREKKMKNAGDIGIAFSILEQKLFPHNGKRM